MDETLTIRFRINGHANLTVRFMDSNGKTVKTLANEQPFTQGEHTLTWDGTTDSGELTPEGTYSVQITATPRSRQEAIAQGKIQLTLNPLSIAGVSVMPETIRFTAAERRCQLVYPDLGELGTFDAFRVYWVFAKVPCQSLIPSTKQKRLCGKEAKPN